MKKKISKDNANSIPEDSKENYLQGIKKKQIKSKKMAITDIENSKDIFPVVGVGASAGGLAPFKEFISAMPGEISEAIAIVFIQHLAPDHESILTELIRDYTKMNVFEIEDEMKVERNCIYVIPPGYNIAIKDGFLRLSKPIGSRFQNLPIDFFFRTLAEDCHEKAIAIILSGTGSDGTSGIKMLKGEGGIVMVQNPDLSEYNGMPCHAIDTGLVDYILSPVEMSHQLINYISYSIKKTDEIINPETKNKDALEKLFIMLLNHTGHEFSGYKQNMVIRRVERRMAIYLIKTIDEYILYLQKNTNELDKIFQDLLIGVTSFFRDTDAFTQLEKHVIPELFTDNSSETIRIWVSACSTGEEAY